MQVQLQGITRDEIQALFQQVLRHEQRNLILALDVSYGYTFQLDDFELVRRHCLLTRYNKKAVLTWHEWLERWYADQTVVMGNQPIKPIQIERSFDKVVNEGLEAIAGCLSGEDSMSFDFRSIGKGTVVEVLPSDKVLADEINRINVNTTPDGGSMSHDGSTIYSIGNHNKGVESASITECGIQSEENAATDMMLDHSKFATPITHTQNVTAPGSTTIIYMCAA